MTGAHRTRAEFEASVEHLRESPTDGGTVELIVRRPAVDEREILSVAHLRLDEGIAGDTWRARGSRHTPDGSAEADRQITIMNARAIAMFAGEDRARWAEAGDQLYIDLDLSEANLPAGTTLQLGSAVIEITDKPHTGCVKFAARFGADARTFVNSPVGSELRLRGINARVLMEGGVRVGDVVTKTVRPSSGSASSPAADRTVGARPAS